ncbi:AraC family transcriptional regulator [Dictyoglomus thermophilum]|uniref:Transcriptional regulator, putative n=1 Tax=Dictyoglomus thermophilum (strain ATCC 35947 / DSM 3960 / H-6-12) TaxID=309799 RepID=B5YFJ6_DICT6|nr:helix-turn-helix domain-containing protein [Dictyoglomus thermophilum]ACI19046.1 transcriptional regulator, putative [Dictyoglomus thermophilum H-6-12]
MRVRKKELIESDVSHGTPDFPLFVHEDIFVYRNGVVNPHWHNEFEILYMERGIGKFYVDGYEYKLNEGEYLFVNSGSIHSGLEMIKRSIGYAIVFDLRLLYSEEPDYCKHEYFLPLINKRYHIPSNLNDEHIRNDICRIIEVFKEKSYGYELYIKSLLFDIFWRVFKYYAERRNQDGRLGYKIERIKDVLNYINQNYNKNLSLDELSRQVDMSKFYLCRLFKESLRMSPVEYINKVRVDKAMELLINTDMSVSEIAFECGFDNISYFIKVFKKYMHTTPLKFRKQNL